MEKLVLYGIFRCKSSSVSNEEVQRIKSKEKLDLEMLILEYPVCLNNSYLDSVTL